MKKGIDVSEWQGDIDHKAVKSAGIDFAILRDGFGFSTIDKTFFANVVGFKNAGIAIPAIYHMSYALNEEDAKEEARFACKLAEEAGLPKSTIIFYDLEYDNVDRYAVQNKVTIDKTKCCAMTVAFCDTVKRAGYQAGIYANTDYRDRMYTSAVINNYIFWHADYRTTAKPDERAVFFQKSSEGRISGIKGNVDLDECLKEIEVSETIPEPKKSVEELANEVIEGKWGNGEARKKRLTDAGYDYSAVQSLVDKLVTPPPNEFKKAVNEIATEVIEGKWGNGDERKKKLKEAGYDYYEIQNAVEQILAKQSTTTNGKSVSPAQSRDDSLAGTYKVIASALNMRYIPNKLTSDNIVKVLKSGDKVQNYGFYTKFGNSKWLLIQHGNETGWVDSSYVKK